MLTWPGAIVLAVAVLAIICLFEAVIEGGE